MLLCDLGNDFNVTAGETKKVAFSVSNYDTEAPGARLEVCLEAASDGTRVWNQALEVGTLPVGMLSRLGSLAVKIPASDVAKKYLLRACHFRLFYSYLVRKNVTVLLFFVG